VVHGISYLLCLIFYYNQILSIFPVIMIVCIDIYHRTCKTKHNLHFTLSRLTVTMLQLYLSLKTKVKSTWQTAKKIFADYSKNSTIHGVSYMAEKERPWLEKVLWITVFCSSIILCGKLIFDAWNISPIIFTFASKPIPIYQIPFPAVTICSLTLSRSRRLNVTKIILGIDSFQNLTEKE
jgi:Amiloride-sensitive sodium channel